MNNNKKEENIRGDLDLDVTPLNWGKFSLHINQRDSVLALILSNSCGLQKRLASYPYDSCPSLDDLANALETRILHVCPKSLDRALKKWAGFIEVDLPKIILAKRRERLVSAKQMSESLDRLADTVKTLKQDPSIHDPEYRDKFIGALKEKLELLHSGIAGDVGPKFLGNSEIIVSCMRVQESLMELHKDDPKGVLPENRELAILMWRFWNVVRPIISNNGKWHVLEREAMGRKSIAK